MSPVFSAVILFCMSMVTVSQACLCFPSDTQDDFCTAAIVLRARVWSGPIDAPPDKDDEFSSFYRDQVYSLKIVEIFKGEKEISHLPGVVSVGVRSPSLMVDLHTPTKFSSCSFRLYKGTEYLLSGYVVNNKLRSSFCSLRQEWTYVTPQQRAGLSGHYNKNC